MEIPNCRRWGLCTFLGLPPEDVEHPGEIVREGKWVYVKVIGISTTETGTLRIDLSMSEVNQETGADLNSSNERSVSTFGKTGKTEPPDLYSIHHATIRSVQTYGAFCRLDGYRKEGLVHVSAIYANQRVEAAGDVLRVGEKVWVKVVEIKPGTGPTDYKIALSMKAVDQTTGADVEPSIAGGANAVPMGVRQSSSNGGGFGGHGEPCSSRSAWMSSGSVAGDAGRTMVTAEEARH